MLLRFIFFLLLLSIINTTKANITKDSTRLFFPQNYGTKKWKPAIGLDARRSFYNSQKIKINGLRLGAQYKGVHRFGLGFYELSKKIEFKNIIVDVLDAKTPSSVKVSLGFTTIFYERVILKTKKWEISAPLYIGSGKLRTEYLNNFGNYKSLSKTPFSAIGVSLSIKYYIWSWLAPKVSFGYRFTYNTNPEISSAFNKPFYAFGISISPVQLFKSIFSQK